MLRVTIHNDDEKFNVYVDEELEMKIILAFNNDEPFEFNGILKYVGEADTVYKRVLIDSDTKFSLNKVKMEDIPGYKKLS